MLTVRSFRREDEESVVRLWELCGLARSGENSRDVISRRRDFQPELLLVGVVEEVVVATALASYDGRRGYVSHVGVHPDRRRRGVGRAMMVELERVLRSKGCTKVKLQVWPDDERAIGFYRELGYELEDLIDLGKRL